MRWRLLVIIAAASSLAGMCTSCSAEKTFGGAPITVTHAAVSSDAARPTVPAGTFDHSRFERLLVAYVNDDGWVDYAGLARDRTALDAYLDTLASINPQSFVNDDERLAFWINAYNAFTLRDALDDVYRKAGGVKDVSGFFDRKKHRIAGEDLTLDKIERRARDFHDPRIHFAVVCASTSCPKLQRYTYKGVQLNEQLDRVTREFLMDEQRGLRVDRERKRIYVSSLFKWYASDFEGKTGNLSFYAGLAKAAVTGGKTLEHIADYVTPEVEQFIAERKPKVHFLDYDWSLNAQETHRSANGETR